MGNSQSSTGLTASGKPCKKCKKKGEPCHLHCDIATDTFDRFESIPLPAMEEILLKLDRKELYEVCTTSKQAAKICGTFLFKKKYLEKHGNDKKGLIIGDLDQSDESSFFETRGRSRELQYFKDEIGNAIRISAFVENGNYVVDFVVYTNVNGLSIYYAEKATGRNFQYVWRLRSDDENISEKLEEIGHADWINELTPVRKKEVVLLSAAVRGSNAFIIPNEIGNRIWNILRKRLVDTDENFSGAKLAV